VRLKNKNLIEIISINNKINKLEVNKFYIKKKKRGRKQVETDKTRIPPEIQQMLNQLDAMKQQFTDQITEIHTDAEKEINKVKDKVKTARKKINQMKTEIEDAEVQEKVLGMYIKPYVKAKMAEYKLKDNNNLNSKKTGD